jgi:hypothetical protein
MSRSTSSCWRFQQFEYKSAFNKIRDCYTFTDSYLIDSNQCGLQSLSQRIVFEKLCCVKAEVTFNS